MLTPMPTQLSGAAFLAGRPAALLADEPRVGKTGAAIIAADLIMAQRICVVTTASGRAVWRKAFDTWPKFPRSVSIGPSAADVQIVSWAGISDNALRAKLLAQTFDLLILDESHYAKTFSAGRTRAVYGDVREIAAEVIDTVALRTRAAVIWCLTGTPIADTPADLFPMMRTLCPERLAADGVLPDVLDYSAFKARYLYTEPRQVGAFEWREQIVGTKNLAELKGRLEGFFLRRTQAEVGIRAPIYETMPLLISEKIRRQIDSVDTQAVLDAAERGDTRELEMHLGPMRRLTGEIKAKAVVEAVREALDNGLDKIVLMAWHTDVIDSLFDSLLAYKPVRLQGSTDPREREREVKFFDTDATCRIFIGQILAAGEAIDLSAASELWFVESSFVPKDMAQAALRITNHTQRRQAFVKVCTLAGSIDEALQTVLLRKVADIREVLS